MTKVALYARVSTEDQAEEGFSIDGQIDTLRDYCRVMEYDVVEIYKDQGYSGKNMKRPDLQRMLRDAEKGLFDFVMVWKYSRLSRKQLEFLTIMEKLEQCNVQFFSFTERVDTSTPAGKLLMQTMSSFAEFERNTIVENVKMGMEQRAKQGKWNGGQILGYKSVNKELQIVPEEAELVRNIFDLYVSGKGYKAITNLLNHEGYKTKKGKAFSCDSIKRIVTNPVYAGYVRYGQVRDWNNKRRKGKQELCLITEGIHEPIVVKSTWEMAQEMFRQKSYQPIKRFDGCFPLSGLLRCPACGKGMVGYKGNKTRNRYYVCGEFHRKGTAVCHSNLVRADEAERVVFQRLEEIATDEKLLKSVVQRVNEKITRQKEPLTLQLRETEAQIKKVNADVERFFSLLQKSNIEIVANRLSDLQEKLNTLVHQKSDLERSLAVPTVQELPFSQIKVALYHFSDVLRKASPTIQKEMLNTIVSQVSVNSSEDIDGRTVKDIQLFFDTSVKGGDDVVTTCGTVHRIKSRGGNLSNHRSLSHWGETNTSSSEIYA